MISLSPKAQLAIFAGLRHQRNGEGNNQSKYRQTLVEMVSLSETAHHSDVGKPW